MSDQIKTVLAETLIEGLDEIIDNATEAAKSELTAIAKDVVEAAIAGDTDTINELADQVLLVGELQRVVAVGIARDKMQIVIRTAFNFAVKDAIAAI